MEYIIWVALYLLAVIVLNGIFNKPWQEKLEYRIHSILNERIFKDLLSITRPDVELAKSTKLTVPSIYISFLKYLRTRKWGAWHHLTNIYTHNLDIPKIKFSDPFSTIRSFNNEIEKKDSDIIKIIGNNNFNDFNTKLETHVTNRYDDLTRASYDDAMLNKHLKVICRIIPEEISGIKLWEQWNKFEECNKKCEFEDDDHYINDLLSLKLALIDISYSFRKLLCDSVAKESDKEKLDTLIQERDQLEMLNWCIIHYASARPANAISRFIWRLIIILFIRKQ